MKVLITGGGGFIGYRLARKLLERGTLAGADGKPAAITGIKLLDAAFPPDPDPRLARVTGDVTDPATIERVLDADTGSVFHLAAVVSGGAEADFDLGYRVNLDGMRLVLERCRRLQRPPRLVFASSVAAFGGDLPEVLDDSTVPNPQTSYGAQKVIGEYLVTDFTRKGFIDGRSLRLPTIVVRPGKPNLAASSFASSIFREPLNGIVAECPVAEATGIWLLSPRKVVDAFIHAHELRLGGVGDNAGGEPARNHGDREGRRRRPAPDRRRRRGGARAVQARGAHPGDRADLAGTLPDAAGARDGVCRGSRRRNGIARLRPRRRDQALAADGPRAL